jgi:hypothetical protein
MHGKSAARVIPAIFMTGAGSSACNVAAKNCAIINAAGAAITVLIFVHD